MTNSLENTPPKNFYGDLIHLSNGNAGVDATLRTIYDGKGNATCVMISINGMKINGDLEVTGSLVGQLQLSDDAPQPLGSASGGESLSGSRGDHVHPHGNQGGERCTPPRALRWPDSCPAPWRRSSKESPLAPT